MAHLLPTALAAPGRAPALAARLLPAALAALLGLTLLVGVGLSHPPALHNATHDARHTLGFPCH